MALNKLPSKRRLSGLYLYDYNTGKLLRKKQSSYFNSGPEVGSLTKFGYLRTKIDGKFYMVHRLIWKMCIGNIPKNLYIDHIDGNKSNNLISNLRLVSSLENQKNKSIGKNNTSGCLGVYSICGTNKFYSQIKIGEKTKHLGVFSSFEEAVIARKKAEKRFKFHKNHGRALSC